MKEEKKSPENKKASEKSTIPKTHWNIYSLQKLNISKFVCIIDKVFKGDMKLTK